MDRIEPTEPTEPAEPGGRNRPVERLRPAPRGPGDRHPARPTEPAAGGPGPVERLLAHLFGVATDDGARPRASAPRPGDRALLGRGRRGRRGRVGAALLLVGLAGALAVLELTGDDAGAQGRTARPAAVASSGPDEPVTAADRGPVAAGLGEGRIDAATQAELRERVPTVLRERCRPVVDRDPLVLAALTCRAGGGLPAVEYRLYATVGSLRARYDAERGDAPPDGVHSGGAACADGDDDERSWALPDAPLDPEGRYACRLVDGVATMWWTADRARVLGTARSDDGDLGALFAWWLGSSEA